MDSLHRDLQIHSISPNKQSIFKHLCNTGGHIALKLHIKKAGILQ